MIVLSILIALWLEAWIEHAHHTHAAELASRRMTTELRQNLAETHYTLQQMKTTITSLKGDLQALERHRTDAVPDETSASQ